MAHDESQQPTQLAVMLAAGMGTRLGALTADAPKCMVQVNGVAILERAVRRLEAAGIAELLVVTGYKAEAIVGFLKDLDTPIKFRFVHSPEYATTNNIYSLWLAGEQINEPFLLLESDVVFKTSMLSNLMPPCAASLSPMQDWMNGTVASIDDAGMIDRMYLKEDALPDRPVYKTVNMYSFDLPSWRDVVRPRLDAAISGQQTASYYEAVFAQAVADGDLQLRAVVEPVTAWYEVDTPQDLEQAQAALDRQGD